MNSRVPADREPAPPPPPEAKAPSTLAASALGFVVAAGLAGAVAWASGCHGDAPPGASVDKPAR
ncbi:MAG TPA: hypothetical protein VM694_08125, partial [Polyangium sp.]|nr:hypothetical protein [Polyangium sp.]